MLHALIEDNDPKFIKEVKVLYQGKDKNEIYKWLEWARNNNMEGIMINLSESPYECKRTKNILKVKVMQDVDLKVVGLEEGSGNLKGTLGRINVEFKDNVLKVFTEYHKDVEKEEVKYIRKGIAERSFSITKTIDKSLELVGAKYEDGCLIIEFRKKDVKEPESKRIEIQ